MEKLLSIREVAEHLGVSSSLIYKLVSRKAISFVKIGSRVLFNTTQLQKFIEKKTKGGLNG